MSPARTQTRWPLQNAAAMNAFYGNPDANRDGRADPAWSAANLVRLKPAYPMQWSWGGDIASLTVHRKCADSLRVILENIARHYGSQTAIEKARMHLCGGVFNFRLKRGGSTLSIHSWGAAIDLDPVRNGLGRRHREGMGMMPLAVVEIFAAEGWIWGGRWSRPDAMHFQAARLSDTPAMKSQKARITPAVQNLISATFQERKNP